MKIPLLALAAALALVGCGSDSSSSSSQQPLTCSTPSPAQSAAQQPAQIIKLGTQKVGTTVNFTVPAGAASITIVEQIVSAPANAIFANMEGRSCPCTEPNSAIPLKVTDSTGRDVFCQFRSTCGITSDPTQQLLYYASLSPGTGTLTLPDTTAGLDLVAAGLPAGTWSFVVSDLAHVCTLASNCANGGGSTASTYDVTVIVKPGAAAGAPIPATGTIDVTFNLTPGNITPPISAATAKAGTDADLNRMVSSLKTLLLQHAGLTLNVDFVKVPDAAATKVATGVNVDDETACGALSQLLATAPAGRQVNIFMVPSFVLSDTIQGTTVVGFDGTIPGPATFSPTLQSGGAVSVEDLRFGTPCSGGFAPTSCGADKVAYYIAHEMGHYLGLYHVTEAGGTTFDPLTDTPTCPCASCAPASQCADPQQGMRAAQCTASTTCDGGDNLMFWVFENNVSVGNLTTDQGKVMRANTAVY